MESNSEKTLLTWAVKENTQTESTVTLSFDLWMTPEEAIEGYCKLTGKTWEQLTSEGAQLVQKAVIIRQQT